MELYSSELKRLTVFLAVFVIGFLVLMFTRTFRETIQEAYDRYPKFYLKLLPWVFCFIHLWYSFQTGGIGLEMSTRIFCALSIGAWLFYRADCENKKLNHYDLLAWAFLWLTLDTRWVGSRPWAIKKALDWHLVNYAWLAIGLVGWTIVRGQKTEQKSQTFVVGFSIKYPNLIIAFRFNSLNLIAMLGGCAFLATFGVWFGVCVGYLSPKEFLSDVSLSQLPSAIFPYLATKKFLAAVVGYAMSVAWAEEFWFRVVLNRILAQFLGCETRAWVITSFVFGLSHLNNHAKYGLNWKYAAVATLAGLVYGLVYRLTGKLRYPVLVHAIADAVCATLFVVSGGAI